MIDPLPPPVTALTHETVESKDHAVLVMHIRGARVRALFSRDQVKYAAAIFGRLAAEMEEVERISAVKNG